MSTIGHRPGMNGQQPGAALRSNGIPKFFLIFQDSSPRIRSLKSRQVMDGGHSLQFLYPLCTRLILVDLVSKCIDACRRRFACVDHIEYHVNDGRSLDAIENNSVDFVFSMDSLVHADPTVMREYTLQLGRKLRDGGLGFIHHSNLGAYHHWLLAKSLIVKCCRGNCWLGNLLIHDCLSDRNMTAAQMRRFLEESKLECVSQETFPWGSSRRPIDAFTVFRNK